MCAAVTVPEISGFGKAKAWVLKQAQLCSCFPMPAAWYGNGSGPAGLGTVAADKFKRCHGEREVLLELHCVCSSAHCIFEERAVIYFIRSS